MLIWRGWPQPTDHVPPPACRPGLQGSSRSAAC